VSPLARKSLSRCRKSTTGSGAPGHLWFLLAVEQAGLQKTTRVHTQSTLWAAWTGRPHSAQLVAQRALFFFFLLLLLLLFLVLVGMVLKLSIAVNATPGCDYFVSRDARKKECRLLRSCATDEMADNEVLRAVNDLLRKIQDERNAWAENPRLAALFLATSVSLWQNADVWNVVLLEREVTDMPWWSNGMPGSWSMVINESINDRKTSISGTSNGNQMKNCVPQ